MLSAVAFFRLAETVFVGLVIVKVVQIIFGHLKHLSTDYENYHTTDELRKKLEEHQRTLKKIARSPSALGPVIAEEALKESD